MGAAKKEKKKKKGMKMSLIPLLHRRLRPGRMGQEAHDCLVRLYSCQSAIIYSILKTLKNHRVSDDTVII